MTAFEIISIYCGSGLILTTFALSPNNSCRGRDSLWKRMRLISLKRIAKTLLLSREELHIGKYAPLIWFCCILLFCMVKIKQFLGYDLHFHSCDAFSLRLCLADVF